MDKWTMDVSYDMCSETLVQGRQEAHHEHCTAGGAKWAVYASSNPWKYLLWFVPAKAEQGLPGHNQNLNKEDTDDLS